MKTTTRTLAAALCAAGVLAAGCGDGGRVRAVNDDPAVTSLQGGAAPLPLFDPAAASDPALGRVPAPLAGPDLFGDGTVSLHPGEDGPAVVIFAAHWCPHCNREVPRIAQLWRDGGVPPGVRVVLVSTAAREGTEHWPPHEWLRDDMDWPGELDVLDGDAADGDPAEQWGLTGFPYLVALDADGEVAFRHAGEIPAETLGRVLEELAAGQ